MINLNTNYAGLSLRNPIIVGSSGLTQSAERNLAFEKAGAGAIVLKSLFEEQIEMQSSHLIGDESYPEALDYVRGYVKAHQLNDYLDLIKKTKELCSIPVIASVNCYKSDAWTEYAYHIQEAGADALELNIYYMNTGVEYSSDNDLKLYASILRRIKSVVSIPVIVKIGKMFGNIVSLVHTLKSNGADAVVLFNRFYSPDIDIKTMKTVSANVFSSSADLGDTLRWTGIVSGKVSGIDLAASTGVHTWEDVVKCLLVGSTAVQMCSALYEHGADLISETVVCLEEWLRQNNYESVAEVVGKLNCSNIADPSSFERAQFMKYFSDRN